MQYIVQAFPKINGRIKGTIFFNYFINDLSSIYFLTFAKRIRSYATVLVINVGLHFHSSVVRV